MNSIQLAQRLARNMSYSDLSTMPGAAMLDVVDAINAGLQELYSLLPSNYKQTAVSTTLKGPQSVAVTVESRYSNLITSNAFTQEMQGCTVNVNDDTHDNEVTGPNSLLDGFVGSVLSGTAMVHFDAVPILSVVERITSNPRIYRGDGTWWPLQRREDFKETGIGIVYNGWRASNIKRQTGRPLVYLLEQAGASQGAGIEFFFRVYPMPDTDYTLRFEAELSPGQITFSNVTQAAVKIPVNERLASSVLVPICEDYLLRSPFFKDKTPTTLSLFSKAADRAREQARNRVARDILRPDNSIGTPGSVGNSMGCSNGF